MPGTPETGSQESQQDNPEQSNQHQSNQDQSTQGNGSGDTLTLPLVSLTSGVILPGMVFTLTLETEEARAAVEAAPTEWWPPRARASDRGPLLARRRHRRRSSRPASCPAGPSRRS